MSLTSLCVASISERNKRRVWVKEPGEDKGQQPIPHTMEPTDPIAKIWNTSFPSGKDTQVLFDKTHLKILVTSSSGTIQEGSSRVVWALADVIGVYPRDTISALIPPVRLPTIRGLNWEPKVWYFRMGHPPKTAILQAMETFLSNVFVDKADVDSGLENIKTGHSILLQLNRFKGNTKTKTNHTEQIALVVFQVIRKDTVLVTHIAVAAVRVGANGKQKYKALLSKKTYGKHADGLEFRRRGLMMFLIAMVQEVVYANNGRKPPKIVLQCNPNENAYVAYLSIGFRTIAYCGREGLASFPEFIRHRLKGGLHGYCSSDPNDQDPMYLLSLTLPMVTAFPPQGFTGDDPNCKIVLNSLPQLSEVDDSGKSGLMLALHRHHVFQRGYGLLSREEDQTKKEDHVDEETGRVRASLETIDKLIKPLNLVDWGSGEPDNVDDQSKNGKEDDAKPKANSCLFVCFAMVALGGK